MPKQDSEGLARLADGTERAIIYEPDWKNNLIVCHYEDNQNTDNKLRIRKAGVPVINFEYIDAEPCELRS